MSAWKPSVLGPVRPASSRSTMRFQLCMPPQQISPSAASRSPWSSAMSQASRNVSAICFVVARRDRPPSRSGSPAESMRTTPYGRMPSSRSVLAMRQALRTCVRKFLRSSSLAHRRAAAGRRPDRRDDASRRRGRAPRSCRRAASGRRRSNRCSTCGSNRNRSTPSNFTPSTFGGGRQVEHRVEVDRRLASPAPLPTRPGHMAL